MTGGYRHIVNEDGSFRGVDLLDHLGDAYEALEECYEMIQYLNDGNKTKIYKAWRDGYFKKYHPTATPPTESEFWS